MKRRSIFPTLLLFALILSACGARAEGPQIVEVSLTEFAVQSELTSFEAGRAYRFVVTNSGALNHEFTIMPPGTTGAMEMEGQDMGDMSGALVHIAADQLPPGASVTVDYVFSQPASLGSLEFACYVPGHYEAGMFVPIGVEG